MAQVSAVSQNKKGKLQKCTEGKPNKMFFAQIPTPPTDGDWTNWIIGTLMTFLLAVATTAVTLTRIIDTKYVKEVAKLEAALSDSKLEHKSITEEMRAEIKECHDERFKLAVRIAALEANTNALDHNTQAVDRNTRGQA